MAIKQHPKLRVEQPQMTAKWVKDVGGAQRLEAGEALRMWTIVSDFYDQKGFNRKNGTFTELGLKELNIIRPNGGI